MLSVFLRGELALDLDGEPPTQITSGRRDRSSPG
jgi:hypothetical protein